MNKTEEALSLPLTASSGAGSGSPPNLEAIYLKAARQIFSCYRRDDAVDPDGYVAAAAAVLSEYSLDVIEREADPRTGIARRSKFLPNAADIAKDCDDIAKKIAEDMANEKFQQRKRRTPRYAPAVTWAPNLFVPTGFPGYEQMVERSKTEKPDRFRFEKAHLCHDGERRDGIWVQSSWWDHRGGSKEKSFAQQIGDIKVPT